MSHFVSKDSMFMVKAVDLLHNYIKKMRIFGLVIKATKNVNNFYTNRLW